jgi:hypothetical protein
MPKNSAWQTAQTFPCVTIIEARATFWPVVLPNNPFIGFTWSDLASCTGWADYTATFWELCWLDV